MDPQRLIPGDPTLVENIVNYLKAKGIFDEFRHECLADVDTKSSCQNLSQRVDGYTSKFLANETWHPDMNKNELRNKLRRNLDESGMLAVGADHVVEQVINPKIHQLFLPKIIEVVHQYIKEQNELFNKKHETTSSDNTPSLDKSVHDTSESSKVKTSISDPIADILSFTYSKSKSAPTTSNLGKNDSTQQKHADSSKTEKKKEEKSILVAEKSTHEVPAENTIISAVTESKMQTDKEKEKVKKEEHEISQLPKKSVKEELKPEKKKTEELKVQNVDTVAAVEENKASVPSTSKPSVSGKKDVDKDKQKIKSSSTPKSSSSSSEIKKPKKELSEKPSEKPPEKSSKSKPIKSSKESASPVKSIGSGKSVLKEEKFGEILKSKSSDSNSSKTSESSVKKPSKSGNVKKDNSKQKGYSDKSDKSKASKSSEKGDLNIHSDLASEKTDKSKQPKLPDKSDQNTQSDSTNEKAEKFKTLKSTDKNDSNTHYDSSSEKTEKSKISKSADKNDQNIHYDSSNSEKVSKSAQYSSSYDSSQGSDQEKSSSSSSKKERQKHFYKHAEKEKSKKHPDKNNKSSTDKKRPSDSDESPSKKTKTEKVSKFEKLKDATVVEAAKINSRSNSFGSTSSISSSSNTSKDNLVSTNSDEVSENSIKDKKKKQIKEKDSCQNPAKELPPPPPPPPSSSSLLCELPSSTEMSSVEDTQSSVTSETSSSESMSEESSSDSESESKDLESNTLNESILNSSSDDINDFYDIFLYSSSSSEFEGFEKSPEKKKKEDTLQDVYDSDVSVSSVHTSDLSSYDDEISDDDFVIRELQGSGKRRITLKEAQELIQNKAAFPEKSKNLSTESAPDIPTVSCNDGSVQKSSTHLSSDEEVSPSEPKRSLRRERKLNPRYASSEYTSIFNCRKETFITKQSSPSVRNSSSNSSPNSESKYDKKEVLTDKSKFLKKCSLEAKMNAVHKDEMEQLEQTKSNVHNSKSCAEKESSDVSGMSSSDEMDSIMNKETYQERDDTVDNPNNNHLKTHLKFKTQNNSKLKVNSYSLKRKLPVTESTPVKRPCSRSSVDSSSSEFAPNENKPFNSETQNIIEDKVLRDSNMKGSDLTDGIKKDPFCKQRTNNNGDILGQKDIFPKNSHGKTMNMTSEKKTSESDTSKELNAL